MRRRNPPPTEPPEFFLDRSLGKRVAEALREAGWTVHPMFEVFPRSEYKRIEDVTWIPRATEYGWPILAKDAFRIPAERRMITRCAARVFSLPNASMTVERMVERFLVSEGRIRAECLRAGPYHYSVTPTSLRLLKLLR